MTAPLQTVHVRVNDAATGQPTPCRVRFTQIDGKYYAPFGRLTEFSTRWSEHVGGNVLLDGKQYAYIDGTCEIQLPPGTIHVEIHKGPEYRPLCRDIERPAGKLALRLELERWADLRSEGWYSGDVRAYFLTADAALLEGAAEDLAVVNLLAVEHWPDGGIDSSFATSHRRLSWCDHSDHAYPWLSNILAFSGQRTALEMPGHMVVVNTYNMHPVLGALSLLNCHRAVYPLRFGGSGRLDDWTLADWCDQCHRKGGLVVCSELYTSDGTFNDRGEACADIILGKIDALELAESSHVEWCGLLNAGFRVPLVGGSGKNSNASLLGAVRTYAQLLPGENLTYKAWIEAVRTGRTFVTGGPLLSLTVNSQGPGAIIDLSKTGQTVEVRAEARSLVPFERLEILMNGKVIARRKPKGSPPTVIIEKEVTLKSSGWLAACCWEPGNKYEVLAHTSPVYLQLAGQPIRPKKYTLHVEEEQLDRMLQWVRCKARCENEHQRERLAAVFLCAREELLRRQGN